MKFSVEINEDETVTLSATFPDLDLAQEFMNVASEVAEDKLKRIRAKLEEGTHESE